MTLAEIARLPEEQQRTAMRRYILDAAQQIFLDFNISEIRPDARGGVLVSRGYGPYAVQGYADSLPDAIQRALEESGRSL